MLFNLQEDCSEWIPEWWHKAILQQWLWWIPSMENISDPVIFPAVTTAGFSTVRPHCQQPPVRTQHNDGANRYLCNIIPHSSYTCFSRNLKHRLILLSENPKEVQVSTALILCVQESGVYVISYNSQRRLKVDSARWMSRHFFMVLDKVRLSQYLEVKIPLKGI